MGACLAHFSSQRAPEDAQALGRKGLGVTRKGYAVACRSPGIRTSIEDDVHACGVCTSVNGFSSLPLVLWIDAGQKRATPACPENAGVAASLSPLVRTEVLL
jgi:hypothetical protein